MANKQVTGNAVEIPMPGYARAVRPTLSVGLNPESDQDMEFYQMVNRAVLVRKAETQAQRYGVKQLLEEFLLGNTEFQAAVSRWAEKFGPGESASMN